MYVFYTILIGQKKIIIKFVDTLVIYQNQNAEAWKQKSKMKKKITNPWKWSMWNNGGIKASWVVMLSFGWYSLSLFNKMCIFQVLSFNSLQTSEFKAALGGCKSSQAEVTYSLKKK